MYIHCFMLIIPTRTFYMKPVFLMILLVILIPQLSPSERAEVNAMGVEMMPYNECGL